MLQNSPFNFLHFHFHNDCCSVISLSFSLPRFVLNEQFNFPLLLRLQHFSYYFVRRNNQNNYLQRSAQRSSEGLAFGWILMISLFTTKRTRMRSLLMIWIGIQFTKSGIARERIRDHSNDARKTATCEMAPGKRILQRYTPIGNLMVDRMVGLCGEQRINLTFSANLQSISEDQVITRVRSAHVKRWRRRIGLSVVIHFRCMSIVNRRVQCDLT